VQQPQRVKIFRLVALTRAATFDKIMNPMCCMGMEEGVTQPLKCLLSTLMALPMRNIKDLWPEF
jgi:hypothetical protein